MADKGKSVKINTTKETNAGDVLSSTLAGMEQWDMNKIDDTTGDHPEFNGPSKQSGK